VIQHERNLGTAPDEFRCLGKLIGRHAQVKRETLSSNLLDSSHEGCICREAFWIPLDTVANPNHMSRPMQLLYRSCPRPLIKKIDEGHSANNVRLFRRKARSEGNFVHALRSFTIPLDKDDRVSLAGCERRVIAWKKAGPEPREFIQPGIVQD